MQKPNLILKIAGGLLLAWLLTNSCIELFNAAWGTGNRIGNFSLTWAVMFAIYSVFCIVVLGLTAYANWNGRFHQRFVDKVIRFRNQIRSIRYGLVLITLIIPVYLFQFTMWGIVFQGIYIRLLVWLIAVSVSTILASAGGKLISRKTLLGILVLCASTYSVVATLKYVTSYPFSLGWSEGNRLWDYSIMFGRERYDYPLNKEIFVLLEPGRQFVGAVAFLIPGLKIETARLWVGLLAILPYLLLGSISFRFLAQNKALWIFLSLWAYVFLGQGPIHAPLLLGAALVALAWGNSLSSSIPLLILSGYYISISRFTWIFAPAVWIFMLELTNPRAEIEESQQVHVIKRATLLALSGLLGSVLLPLLIPLRASTPGTTQSVPSIYLLTTGLIKKLASEPLLWYRLFPNQTYGSGILLGIILTTVPLVVLLYYLSQSKHFIKNNLQKWLISLTLLSFLSAGIIISAKIGGGGDLHNLDMYLISLFFTVVIIFVNGGSDWLESIDNQPGWVELVMTFSLFMATLAPLQAMQSFGFIEKLPTILVLTDSSNKNALEIHPAKEDIDKALGTIQTEADQAKGHGEVLFLDQRQLLTFGFIKDVPFVPDYEKKVLMQQALASDQVYFAGFHEDLREKRFSLIISQLQARAQEGGGFEFGEENDAWVKWVSKPLLCYYQIKDTLREVGIQLLVPKEGAIDCSQKLP